MDERISIYVFFLLCYTIPWNECEIVVCIEHERCAVFSPKRLWVAMPHHGASHLCDLLLSQAVISSRFVAAAPTVRIVRHHVFYRCGIWAHKPNARTRFFVRHAFADAADDDVMVPSANKIARSKRLFKAKWPRHHPHCRRAPHHRRIVVSQEDVPSALAAAVVTRRRRTYWAAQPTCNKWMMRSAAAMRSKHVFCVMCVCVGF